MELTEFSKIFIQKSLTRLYEYHVMVVRTNRHGDKVGYYTANPESNDEVLDEYFDYYDIKYSGVPLVYYH